MRKEDAPPPPPPAAPQINLKPYNPTGQHRTTLMTERRVTDRCKRVFSCQPSASWGQMWGAQSRWIKSGQTVHKLIFQTANRAVSAIVHSAKTAYYSTKICASSTCKQLYNIANTLLGQSESSPPSSTLHPQAFLDFFANKIETILHSLDTDLTSLLTVWILI